MLYLKHCGEIVEFDENLELKLKICDEGHREFMKQASKLIFGNFTELIINLRYDTSDQTQKILDEFFENLASVSIKSI